MKKKAALVLSGGGARGIAHIGAIEELEKQGFEITSLAGTSMGSLVAGVHALGKLKEFKEWMLTLDKMKVFNLVDFTFSTQGLVKGDRVLNRIQEFVSGRNIEELGIPYAAVAVDLMKKEEVVFRKGSIFEAIRASISIPSVLTPVKKGEALLVDGGVLNNIPVNHVQRTTGDLLIAVDVNADIPLRKMKGSMEESEEKKSVYLEKLEQFQHNLKKMLSGNEETKMGYFDLMTETISLMTATIARNNMEKEPPDILVEVSRQSAGTYDFFMAEELVERGRTAAREALKQFKATK
jgi:NTE family protein